MNIVDDRSPTRSPARLREYGNSELAAAVQYAAEVEALGVRVRVRRMYAGEAPWGWAVEALVNASLIERQPSAQYITTAVRPIRTELLTTEEEYEHEEG